jgi:hypothetical protein
VRRAAVEWHADDGDIDAGQVARMGLPPEGGDAYEGLGFGLRQAMSCPVSVKRKA